MTRFARQRGRLLLTVALGALVAAGLQTPAEALPDFPAAAAVTPPQDDPFYAPPKGLPGKQPGAVLRSRPITVSQYGFPAGVRAWQVLYRSTSARHEANAVSGTVLVPEGAWSGSGQRPLVSYAVGTHGLGPECAPSYQLASGTENELGLMRLALARGWAVAVTDYEGLGTPGPHTYVAGRSLGHAMLDAARAALRLPAAQLSAQAPVGLWGYSEGGLATGWAAELAASYAPELRTVGAAVGAAPADVGAMAALHDGGPASGLVLAGAVGLAEAYPDAPFEEILTEAGRQAVEEIKDMCVEELAARFAFRRVDSLTTVTDPMALPAWRSVLADVALGSIAPEMPVMVYHSPLDELVLFTQGVQLNRDWCAEGATVAFQPAVLGEHITGAVTGAPLAVDYLAGRFAGRTAPDTCAAAP